MGRVTARFLKFYLLWYLIAPLVSCPHRGSLTDLKKESSATIDYLGEVYNRLKKGNREGALRALIPICADEKEKNMILAHLIHHVRRKSPSKEKDNEVSQKEGMHAREAVHQAIDEALAQLDQDKKKLRQKKDEIRQKNENYQELFCTPSMRQRAKNRLTSFRKKREKEAAA